jgi:hypothetical protein
VSLLVKDIEDAELYNIKCIDGDGLCEIIFNNLSRLSEETKRLLGISLVPEII